MNAGSTLAARPRPRVRSAPAAAFGWEPPAVAGLLGATALLYLWNLAASGWANAFYSAAVQAGTKSWKAFLFGSLDPSNFITVDKPPASLWVMELSARLFGVNAWAILAPEALAGVATVAIVYAAVRRWFGAPAGLLAGAVVALTPVAALMFRYNNPDALLVLLVTAGSYAVLRALEKGRTRWLVLAAALLGTAFLTKLLQAFIVVPVLGGVYLLAGPPQLGIRVRQLAVTAGVLAVSSGWWVATVELWPAWARPYVGGSQDNSELNLIFGYNGFGRLTGNETGSVGGSGVAGSIWGPTGWDRLFNSSFGGQISWLVPAALVLLAGGLWFTRGRPRTDLLRASLLVWGGTLLLTGAVFSFAQGIIHPYYTVALAPAVGGLVGAGGWVLWRHRSDTSARAFLAAALVAAGGWSFVLLNRTPDWQPELRVLVLMGTVAAALGLLITPRAALALAGAALALSGPAAYTLDTVATAHTGAIPSAGPAVATAAGPAGGPPGGGFAGAFGGARPGGPPPGFGGGQAPPSGALPAQVGAAGGPGPAGGGFLDASSTPTALVRLLQQGASRYAWAAATVDANRAAGYELASGVAVMAIGGFNGTDPAPTLAQFQALVRAGRVHYFIAGGARGQASSAGRITAWVEANFNPLDAGGVTVYLLSPAQ